MPTSSEAPWSVDTNILIYATAVDAPASKQRVARDLLEQLFLSPQAWQLTARHTYQVWHALIVAVCAEHGVKTLYSEDAGSLKRPLGVHLVNPFAKLEID